MGETIEVVFVFLDGFVLEVVLGQVWVDLVDVLEDGEERGRACGGVGGGLGLHNLKSMLKSKLEGTKDYI